MAQTHCDLSFILKFNLDQKTETLINFSTQNLIIFEAIDSFKAYSLENGGDYQLKYCHIMFLSHKVVKFTDISPNSSARGKNELANPLESWNKLE